MVLFTMGLGKGSGAGRPAHLIQANPEAASFAKTIIESEEYRASLRRRIMNDDLSPTIEVLLLKYVYGGVAERLEVTVDGQGVSLQSMSKEELRVRTLELLAKIDNPEPKQIEGTVVSSK